MSAIKRFFKRNSHNAFFGALAGFGRSLNRFYENRNHDIYSNGELRVLKVLSEFAPKHVIDGGANVGSYSRLAALHLPEAQIYSFEPVDATYEILKDTTAGELRITAIKQGLYSANVQKEIHLFSSNTHSSLVDIAGLSYETKKKQLIDLVRGDDFMKTRGLRSIDFLKLDVEGAEFDALLGFEEALTRGAIKAIQFEYGYINISTKHLLVDFYKFFESKDYVVGKIFPKTVEFREYKHKYEDFIGPNFIAVEASQKDLIARLGA